MYSSIRNVGNMAVWQNFAVQGCGDDQHEHGCVGVRDVAAVAGLYSARGW